MFLLVTNFIFAANIRALYLRFFSCAVRLLAPSLAYYRMPAMRRCRARASSIPSAMVRSR